MYMKTILRNGLYALSFSVLLYSCIRWVTDYTKNGRLWAQSFHDSLLELGVLFTVSYFLLFCFGNWIDRNRSVREPRRWKFVWRAYGVPLLFILLCVNATFIFSFFLCGGTFEMDAALIVNVIGVLFGFMIYNLFRSVTLDKEYAEQRIQLEKVRNDQLQTELRLLKSQYHPHFLFNLLNTVYFQIDGRNELPRHTLEKIAELLRYQLYDSDHKVSLRQEIDYLKTYIELRKMRMSERLRLDIDFTEEVGDTRIYPLLYLPLVENAFKFVGGAYRIELLLYMDDRYVHFLISNSLPTFSGESENLFRSADGKRDKGIGLENLRRRLALLYPKGHYFETWKEKDMFRARLTIKKDSL